MTRLASPAYNKAMSDPSEPVRLAVLHEEETGVLKRVTSLSFGPDGTLETQATIEPGLPAAEEGDPPWRVTADNRWLFISHPEEGAADSYRLDRLPLSTLEPEDSCSLGSLRPSSLCPTDHACLLGGAGRVAQVIFTPQGPELRSIFRAEDEVQSGKAVDELTLCGDMLVAVDDRLLPKFAFIFKRDEAGNWAHLYTAPLPEYPNEWFRQATSSEVKLAIRTTFHHRAGSGQRLLLLDVAEDGLTVTAQAMEIRGTGLLKYGRSRLAGRTHSNWNGLGILGDHVFIGAGERGILICRCDMEDEDRARRMKTGGPCLDLLVRGKHIYALVETGTGKKAASSLLILAEDEADGRLVIRATHPLPDHPSLFAH